MWHLAYICWFCRRVVAVYRHFLPHQNRQATEARVLSLLLAQAHDQRNSAVVHSATAAHLVFDEWHVTW